jgi:hypothetical protein
MTIYSGVISYPVRIGPNDRIEPGTAFGSSVEVRDCPAFTGFPDGTAFGSSVEVRDCPAFTGFPDGTAFGSSVAVRACPAFTGFPDGTAFGSWVAVRDCPAFTGSPGCTYLGKPIAFGAEADDRIKRIAATIEQEPDRLKMDDWHCGTSHCIAGWGVHQEGKAGYALEREVAALSGDRPTAGAGLLLLGLEAAGRFYSTDDEARAWLRTKLAA